MNKDNHTHYARLTYVLTKSIQRRFPFVGEEFSSQLAAYATYSTMLGMTQFELERDLKNSVPELNSAFGIALPDNLIPWLVANTGIFSRLLNPTVELEDEED